MKNNHNKKVYIYIKYLYILQNTVSYGHHELRFPRQWSTTPTNYRYLWTKCALHDVNGVSFNVLIMTQVHFERNDTRNMLSPVFDIMFFFFLYRTKSRVSIVFIAPHIRIKDDLHAQVFFIRV